MAWAWALPDALDRLPDDRELVDVEHDPREVANQEHLEKGNEGLEPANNSTQYLSGHASLVKWQVPECFQSRVAKLNTL